MNQNILDYFCKKICGQKVKKSPNLVTLLLCDFINASSSISAPLSLSLSISLHN